MSCLATVWVPSGEPSSTIISSQSRFLGVVLAFGVVGYELGGCSRLGWIGRRDCLGSLLFCEGAVQQPGDDGEVAPFIVGR